MDEHRTYAAFVGEKLVASGPLESMLPQLKARMDRGEGALVLIFDDQTGRQVDFDLRGTPSEVLEHALRARPRSGPGRPKLGVVAREVTLLPRHWSWLEQQPNGASAALRRLVDQARKQDPDKQRARLAMDAACRVMSAMAGNLPGYEEASRALYAADEARFDDLIREWPPDIREYLQRLARYAFQPAGAPASG